VGRRGGCEGGEGHWEWRRGGGQGRRAPGRRKGPGGEGSIQKRRTGGQHAQRAKPSTHSTRAPRTARAPRPTVCGPQWPRVAAQGGAEPGRPAPRLPLPPPRRPPLPLPLPPRRRAPRAARAPRRGAGGGRPAGPPRPPPPARSQSQEAATGPAARRWGPARRGRGGAVTATGNSAGLSRAEGDRPKQGGRGQARCRGCAAACSRQPATPFASW
jgi:hypothetical protein